MTWYKRYYKTAASAKSLREIGVEIYNGNAILYRGTNIPNLTIKDLRYGDFLSAVPTGTDLTGNAGANSYGEYVAQYEIPIKDIKITNGELQYQGESSSLISSGQKYPKEIYRAYNDYYGSNYSANEIDKIDFNEVRAIASIALAGGKEEFDILLKRHKERY